MNDIRRDPNKPTKFRQLKKLADGYVAKNINTGEIQYQTFVPRVGTSKITGQNQVWPKLMPHTGYCSTEEYFTFNQKQKSEIIKKLIEKGWRVIAVNVKEVELSEEDKPKYRIEYTNTSFEDKTDYFICLSHLRKKHTAEIRNSYYKYGVSVKEDGVWQDLILIENAKEIEQYIRIPKIFRFFARFLCKNHIWQKIGCNNQIGEGCTVCGINKPYYDLIQRIKNDKKN